MLNRSIRSGLPLLFLFIAAGLGACASSGSGGSSSDGPRRGGRNLIIQEELANTPATTALEAVQRLRSSWLNARSGGGSIIQVHVDGRPVPGGINVLSSIQVNDVDEIRFRNGRDATTLYGTNYSNGVIEVKTRAR